MTQGRPRKRLRDISNQKSNYPPLEAPSPSPSYPADSTLRGSVGPECDTDEDRRQRHKPLSPSAPHANESGLTAGTQRAPRLEGGDDTTWDPHLMFDSLRVILGDESDTEESAVDEESEWEEFNDESAHTRPLRMTAIQGADFDSDEDWLSSATRQSAKRKEERKKKSSAYRYTSFH